MGDMVSDCIFIISLSKCVFRGWLSAFMLEKFVLTLSTISLEFQRLGFVKFWL